MSQELDTILEGDADLRKIVEGGDIRAGHKIQINFGPGRSGINNFKAILTLWESGKFFHGGGDAHMYTCMDHRLFEADNTTPPSALPIFRKIQKEGRTEWGCGSPITGADIRGPTAMCPGCLNMVPIAYITGQIPFYGNAQELAELAAIVWHRLKDDADIYCKYDRTDIRYTTQAASDGVEKAHKLRGLLIYPLNRILTDITSGSSVEMRFKALFLA